MKEELLKSIAYPSLIFFAPFGLTVFNLTIGVVEIIMFLAFGLVGYIWVPMLQIVIIHLLLILLAKKEPHIDNIIRAKTNIKAKTKNLIKEHGNKFAP
ncbi:MAG: hypothetical protein K2M23_01775 [Alphaproteobacteria bacterium]|nr:hypothetical protein [Alphaproteobacteria bacterium]